MQVSSITRPALAALTVAILAGGASAALATPATDNNESGSAQTFTECMRSHGMPGFPTATITDDGLLTLDLEGTGFDPFSPEYRAALEACRSHLPADSQLPAEPSPPAPPPIPG